MGYRDTVEAASARIQALELEVRALRAAAELPPDPSRLTTPRERELTRALADAQRAVEEARRVSDRPASRRSSLVLGALALVLLSVGMVVLLALVGANAPRRARATRAAAGVVAHVAPAESPRAPTAPPPDEAVCDVR